MKDKQSGWTTPTEGLALRRSDVPPDQFIQETVKADPAAAAWDEPGYVDPDLSHGSFDVGTRYWQGYAKRATPRLEERAMSPGWVARVTAPAPGSVGAYESAEEEAPSDPGDDPDPLRSRVVRETESQRNSWIMPG